MPLSPKSYADSLGVASFIKPPDERLASALGLFGSSRKGTGVCVKWDIKLLAFSEPCTRNAASMRIDQ